MRLNYSSDGPMRKLRKCKLQSLITEFENSGKDFAEIEWDNGEYNNAITAVSALNQALKNAGRFDAFKVVRRGQRVWLMRRDYKL